MKTVMSKEKIEDLYGRGVAGTEILYTSVIKYLVRLETWDEIEPNVSLWRDVDGRCQLGQPDSEKDAEQLKHDLLSIIKRNVEDQRNPSLRNSMKNEFNCLNHESASKIVSEMVACFDLEEDLLHNHFAERISMDSASEEPLQSDELDEIKSSVQLWMDNQSSLGKMKGSRTVMSWNQHQQQLWQSELNALKERMRVFLDYLESRISSYRKAQAWKNAGLLPDHVVSEAYFDWHFSEFASLLNDLLRDLPQDEDMRNMKNKLQNMSLNVIEQPCVNTNIEAETQKQDSQRSNRRGTAGTGQPDRFFTFKHGQKLSCSLKIHGMKAFSQTEKTPTIENIQIAMVAEDTLAKNPQQWRTASTDVIVDYPEPEVSKQNVISISNINAHHIPRKSADDTVICQDFFRLRISCDLIVDQTKTPLSVLTLPMCLYTGKNQLLECIGARLMYCYFSEDLYTGSFKFPEPMYLSGVINMMDNYVSAITKNSRHLSQREKNSLMKRIPGIDYSKPPETCVVTLKNFVKDIVQMKRKSSNTSNLKAGDKNKFGFFTWFYAAVNTLKTKLLGPWQRNIFYGFVSGEDALEIMSDIKESKFVILRFQNSLVHHSLSDKAVLSVVAEIHYGKVDHVPIHMDEVEQNGFYNLLATLLSLHKNGPIEDILRSDGTFFKTSRLIKEDSLNVEGYRGTVITRTMQISVTDKPGMWDDTQSELSNAKVRVTSEIPERKTSKGRRRKTSPDSPATIQSQEESFTCSPSILHGHPTIEEEMKESADLNQEQTTEPAPQWQQYPNGISVDTSELLCRNLNCDSIERVKTPNSNPDSPHMTPFSNSPYVSSCPMDQLQNPGHEEIQHLTLSAQDIIECFTLPSDYNNANYMMPDLENLLQ